MDVRCPSCGTDYELDDARVPDTGLPVKCSKCGHVFRAMRPIAAPVGEPAKVVTGIHSIAPEWMIRRGSGEMVRFRELTTLQRWIVERKVSRTDEISKTGKKWEKLGNIPELAVFFQVVDGQPPAATGPTDTPPPPPMATNPGMPAYQPPERHEYRSTGPDPLSETLPDSSGAYRPMQPPPVVESGVHQLRPRAAEPEEHRQETVRWDMSQGLPDDVRQSYEISGRNDVLPSDEPDIGDERPGRDELAVRRFSPVQMFFGLVLLVAACGVLAYALQPAWVKGLYRRYVSGTPIEAVRSVDEGYATLDTDTLNAIIEATAKFEYAIGVDPGYASAHAGLAEALVAKAETVRDNAEHTASTLAAHPADKATTDQLLVSIADGRKTASELLIRAKDEARSAMDLDDASLAATRAMLAVLVASGEKNGVEALSMQAHAASPGDARLSMIMGELALRDGNLDGAKTLIDAAIAGDAKLNHAKYLLARWYLAKGDNEKALAVARELPNAATVVLTATAGMLGGDVAKAGENGEPTTVKPATGEPETVKPQTGEPGTVKPITEQPTTAKPGTEKPQTAEPQTASPTTDKPAGPKAPDDPTISLSEALNRGLWLRDHDKPGLALKYYERAAIIDVTDPDAHLGIGWCNLELHQANNAITSFKKALELSPRFSDAHFGLAEAFRARGNKLYAIREYKIYLDIAPHGPESDVARTQLERLEDDNTQVNPGDTPAPGSGTTQQPPPPPPPQGMQ